MDDCKKLKVKRGKQTKSPVTPSNCVDPAVGLCTSTSTGYIPPTATLRDDFKV